MKKDKKDKKTEGGKEKPLSLQNSPVDPDPHRCKEYERGGRHALSKYRVGTNEEAWQYARQISSTNLRDELSVEVLLEYRAVAAEKAARLQPTRFHLLAQHCS